VGPNFLSRNTHPPIAVVSFIASPNPAAIG
jgi:hypothetical protein